MTALSAADTLSTTPAPSIFGRFFDADDFDFAARSALGHAAQGISDVGRVLNTLSTITDGDPVSWYTAWHQVAEDHRIHAAAARAAGHTDTAAWFHLAAAEAYDQSLAFIDGMADDTLLLPTFRLQIEAWENAIADSAGRHLCVAVPYEGDTMPGYLFRPVADGAAQPTVIVTNGSDGSLVGLWATTINSVLGRGWNAFVFDGPGQQSMLFERGVPFRHDWEAVLTPVIDALVTRPDVDAAALFGYAISQGGYWLPRAMAYEHRLTAAVVDSGVWDISNSWFSHLPAALKSVFHSGDSHLFDSYFTTGMRTPEAQRAFSFRAKPYGQSSPYALFTEVSKYTLDGIADLITTPTFVADNEAEQFFPGQPQQFFEALACPKKYLKFTAPQGAAGHCEPLARSLFNTYMCDFFADYLPSQSHP